MVFLLVLPGVLLLRRRQLRAAMVARGYRPGSRLSTDFDADGFTVTSSVGSAVHKYADMSFVASAGGMVVLRLRPARLLVVLPAPLLPAECSPALHR
ncbi:MAG: hypothetical protein DLM58_15870 [Pseudonocardiales bacterium]|nr:MAG: hypothetical protein DLM58_15870 [Pseudonocardiales bacterium]